MGIPTGNDREDVPLSQGNEVLDAEPDGSSVPRLLWTAGSTNHLKATDVDLMSGLPNFPPEDIAERSAPYDNANTFPNGAEWGLFDVSALLPDFMGCFFTDWDMNMPTREAQIRFVDPDLIETARNGVPVFSGGQDPGYDYWLFDAWREPSVGPMVIYRKTLQGQNPIQNGEFWVYDPRTGIDTLVPNIRFTPSNTRGRVMRIVEEHLAAIFPLFNSRNGLEPYDTWQLIWQTLGPGANPYLVFGRFWDASTQVLLGVGVRKLTHHSWSATHDWMAPREGYFIYDLRRDESGAAPVDYIDYYILEYDPVGFTLHELVAETVQVQPLLGPDLMTIFEGLGDDENYIDPIGNPCIALTLVETPNSDPNSDPGIVALFNVHYARPYRGDPLDEIVGRFHRLTPDAAGGTGTGTGTVFPHARKDPEPLHVDGNVYIYNRELVPGPSGPQWEMHRTLAWERS